EISHKLSRVGRPYHDEEAAAMEQSLIHPSPGQIAPLAVSANPFRIVYPRMTNLTDLISGWSGSPPNWKERLQMLIEICRVGAAAAIDPGKYRRLDPPGTDCILFDPQCTRGVCFTPASYHHNRSVDERYGVFRFAYIVAGVILTWD